MLYPGSYHDVVQQPEVDIKTAKDEVRELLETLPEDATLEDAQYAIFVRQKVQSGLDAARRGDTASQAEMETRMARWLGK